MAARKRIFSREYALAITCEYLRRLAATSRNVGSPGRVESCETMPTSTATRRPFRNAVDVTSPGLCLSSPGVGSSRVVAGST
eukprot:2908627-Lingulodinium_polyedra.AAC.1